MSKYDFIWIGQKVWYDPYNDGNSRLMQVCTNVPKEISDDTRIALIPVDPDMDSYEEISNEYARADELKPYLSEFQKGYWNAVEDAVENGAKDVVIRGMLKAAGFSYNECSYLIQNSDNKNEKLNDIVRTTFASN